MTRSTGATPGTASTASSTGASHSRGQGFETPSAPGCDPEVDPCAAMSSRLILNYMVQYSQTHFSASFAALADATRRGVLEQLARADASITDLADRFDMTLTGMKKHVGVLEQAGLVTTAKVGRVRTC